MEQTQTETKSLVKRLMEFFQMNATELRKEYAQLSDKDKQELVDAFNKAGMPTSLKA